MAVELEIIDALQFEVDAQDVQQIVVALNAAHMLESGHGIRFEMDGEVFMLFKQGDEEKIQEDQKGIPKKIPEE